MHWKTGTAPLRRGQVSRPSPRQVARQLGVIALASAIWAGVLLGYLQLTKEPEPTVVATAPQPTVIAAAPTHTPLPPSPTSTSTPTATVIPTIPPTEAQDETAATATLAPSATATATATPAPTPTLPPPTVSATPPPPTESAGVSFSGDVLPILQNRCVKCHGGEETKEGLILKTYADLLAGSFNGPVIEPGSAADSLLVELISSGKMPKRNPRLLPSEVELISAWINAGALDN